MSLEDAEESLEKVIGYFYPEESSVLLERIELCSRLHKWNIHNNLPDLNGLSAFRLW